MRRSQIVNSEARFGMPRRRKAKKQTTMPKAEKGASSANAAKPTTARPDAKPDKAIGDAKAQKMRSAKAGKKEVGCRRRLANSSSKSEKTNSTDIEHSSKVAYIECMEEEDNTPATTPTEDEYLPFDGTGLTVKEKYLEGGEISMSMNLKEDRDFGRKW
mmetsp:Transcript_30943/g.53740  ORF Transcript_30943/g.53740 Transcript_30943/m.53740 type:complete len:159 (+) Transcript_30943:104-580(+)